MPKLENARYLTRGHLERDLMAMDDATLQAQEISQKSAIHCLLELRKVGVTESNVNAFLESLEGLGQMISRECKRRGLAVIEVEGHS